MINLEGKLSLPVANYSTGQYLKFGQKIRRHVILWATHLGDDVAVPSKTAVQAIGSGIVVWSEIRRGNKQKRNWGGIIVIKHSYSPNRNKIASLTSTENGQVMIFYSVYGHLNNLKVVAGSTVQQNQQLGIVAAGLTPENGYWQKPHLHFAIYTGPWRNEILPGYWRPEQFWRTRLSWWHDPRLFIKNYEQTLSNQE